MRLYNPITERQLTTIPVVPAMIETYGDNRRNSGRQRLLLLWVYEEYPDRRWCPERYL